jgi:GT2 family glycosyltransferase
LKISVVVPTHRPARGSLERIVDACLKQDIGAENLEIFIVFNLSNDPGRARLPPFPPQIEVLSSALGSERISVNAARNRGALHARGEVILFLDDDCVPTSSTFLREIVDTLESAPPSFVGIGGDYIDSDTANWAARGCNLMTRLWIRYGLESNSEKPRPARQLAGGNMAFRSEIFKKLGFRFDESIVSGGDETELQRRLWNAGHRFLFSSERNLSVVHDASHRDSPPALAALRRAVRQGRAAGKKSELTTPLLGVKGLLRVFKGEDVWRDPAALAFVGLHYSSMLAARVIQRKDLVKGSLR